MTAVTSYTPDGIAPVYGRFNVVEALEVGFLAFVLMLMTSGRVEFLFLNQGKVADLTYLQPIWAAAYLGIVALAVARGLRLVSLTFGILLLVPLIALAFASEAWSIARPVTLHRAFALTMTSILGLLLAARFSWRGLVEFLAGVLLVLAVASMAVCLLKPDLAVHHDTHAGAWKGLWFEKNGFGAGMARGALACVCAAILAPPRRLLWSGGAALCTLMVIMSTSTTALVGLFAAFSAVGGLMALRARGAPAVLTAWLLVVGVALGAVLFLAAPDLFFGAVGKDSTLTGRTDVWGAVLRAVAERPWTGFGYGAFWTVEDGPMAEIIKEIEWTAAHAHNGWLELLLAFGWTGVTLFAIHFGVALLASVGRLWGGAEVYWAGPFLLLILVVSISESTIMQHHDGAWAIYVATAAKLLQMRFAPREAPQRRSPQELEETRLL